MSDRLPSLKADDVFRALSKAGFEVTRIKGSHHIMRHRDDPSRGTVVPIHAGKDSSAACCARSSPTQA